MFLGCIWSVVIVLDGIDVEYFIKTGSSLGRVNLDRFFIVYSRVNIFIFYGSGLGVLLFFGC